MSKRLSITFMLLAALAMYLPAANAVEQLHFGYHVGESYPGLTDALRNSTRIGYVFWSLNQTGSSVPYCYHDGYVEWIGVSKTAAQASQRWQEIKASDSIGDTWTGASEATIGTPTIICLDEVNPGFTDSSQGSDLRDALNDYFNDVGNRSHIVGMWQRSLALTSNPQNGSYDDLIYCINSRLRWASLETYCSHQGFITGTDPDGNNIGQTDDYYLSARLTIPIRNWSLGCTNTRLKANLTPSKFGTYPGYGKSFYKFLNREFWFMANGWYNGTRTAVSTNVKQVLGTGVDGYTWTAGTGLWQLGTGYTTRDEFFEKYIMWYCVGGNTSAHGDGVDAR